MNTNYQDVHSLKPDEELIDLKYFWLIFIMKKWRIFGFSILVTILMTLIVFNITPVYKGTSTLLIESQQANVVSIQDIYELDNSSEYLQTQFEILKSRTLARKVILKLDLLNHPSFNPKKEELIHKFSFMKDINPRETLTEYFPDIFPKEEIKQTPSKDAVLESLVSKYLRNLSISPIRNTQLVRVSFESTNAKLSAEIANEIANSYIENNLEAKLELTMKATAWLNLQLKGQRINLKKAENNLQDYREKENIVGKDGGLGIAEREIDLVSKKLIDAKREKLELKNLYDQIQELGRENASKLQLIPSILSHSLVQNLKNSVAQIELRRTEVANRYGNKHPKMKAINSERSRAYNNLNKQILSIARGIENKYKVSAEAVNALEQSLEITKADMQALSSKEYKLKELQQDVDTKRALYDQFYKRFNETNATGDLKKANARITDVAMVPRDPIKPNKKLLVLLAFAASFLFAFIAAVILKKLDHTLNTSIEIETELGEMVLGLLPLLSVNKRNKYISYKKYIEDPHSAYAESLRTIRTGVILSSIDNPDKIISITSTVPKEGKTSCALGLASALAQVGKILLIDADMRRPSVHKALGFKKDAPGLSNLLGKTHSLDECINVYNEGGFDVLACGSIPPNPSELLSSDRCKDLLTDLASKYDQIIIDTAPCQVVSDALVLASVVDTYIYVVRADSTSKQHAMKGLRRIREVNGNVTGVILNQVDMKKASKYSEEGQNGYYDSYGYSGVHV